jgi:hypothetical protein
MKIKIVQGRKVRQKRKTWFNWRWILKEN